MTWTAGHKRLHLAFFTSGAAALLYEVLWFYQAGLAIGNSYWAATLVVASFMAGLALGNAMAMRWSPGPRRALRAYSLLEAVLAVTGLALVVLLPTLGRMLAPLLGRFLDQPMVVNPLRFLAAFAALLVPSTAMGLTLPLLTQALARDVPSFRSILGRLYGLNTLGAVAGILAGELWLIARIGILRTALVAAAFNLAAAALAWSASRRVPEGNDTAAGPPEVAAKAGPGWKAESFVPLLSVGLAGFLLLALEVVWFRFLSLFVRISSLSFAVMLAVVLTGIALGGLAAAALPRRWPGLVRSAGLLAFLAGVLAAAGYALFPRYHRPPAGEEISTAFALLRVAVPLMFPVSFLSGAFFTFAGAALRARSASAQAAAGLLTLANTLGASGGAAVAGFLLIPWLGIEGALFLLSALYGTIGLAWIWATRESRTGLALGCLLLAGTLAAFPFGTMYSRHLPLAARRWADGPSPRLLDIREGRSETLLYLEFQAFDRPLHQRMLTNSFSMSANNVASRRYMKQYVYWPIALHPRPKSALLICFGVGSTAKALVDSRNLERIDVVDISRDVLEMSPAVFPDPSSHPLRDPRVSVHVEDGRCFLQGSRRRFDLITGEPPPPLVPGVSCLYSQEYFQLLHDRLNEGGIVTYWLPISQMGERASLAIMKAFSNVFQQSYLWHGTEFDLMLVGVRGTLPRAAPEAFEAQWRDPVVGPEMVRLGLEDPSQLGAGFIGDRRYLQRITSTVTPLVDDFPKGILAPFGHSAVYAEFFDAEAARNRFVESSDIQAIWPSEWRDRALPWFALQPLVNTLGKAARRDGLPDLSEVHRLLTGTRLRTLVLWSLGADDDLLAALDRADPAWREGEHGAYLLGMRALADRNPGLAFDSFRSAARRPDLRRRAVACGLLAAGLAGRVPEARALLAEHAGTPEVRSIPAESWNWLERTFGLRRP